jgi:hypothetical protein
MGTVAPSAHQNGRMKSTAKPKTVNVIQKIFRCMRSSSLERSSHSTHFPVHHAGGFGFPAIAVNSHFFNTLAKYGLTS